MSREQVAHSAQLTTEGVCNEQSNGIYGSVNSENQVVTFVLEGLNACSITTTETLNGISNVAVNMNFQKDYTENLAWYIQNKLLYLQTPNDFKGSNQASLCNSNCYCMWLLRSE